MTVKPLGFLGKLLPIKKINLLKSKLHLSGKHLNLQMLGMLFLGAVIPVTILFARTSQDIRQHAHHGDSWSATGVCRSTERNVGDITIRSALAYLNVYEMDVLIDGVNVGKADANGDTIFRKIPDSIDPTNRAKDREITAGTHTIEVVAGDSLPKTAVINCNDVVISSVPSPTPTVNPLPTPTQAPIPTPTSIPTLSAILITSPTNNSGVKPKSKVAINVLVKDKYGIKRVEFYVNNSRLCTDYAAPYECSWLTPAYKAKARYSLTAKSINKINKTSTSNQVSVYALTR